MSTEALKAWVRTLPPSRLKYPHFWHEKLQYLFWKLITPFHNPVRDVLLSLGFLKHKGRQDFLLGRLSAGTTVQEFVEYLLSRGWGNHFIAWEDQGQIVSLRLVTDFKYQYHLRIFEDGEVRGHYEYTPEAHLILHMKEVGLEERREDFLKFLGDKIVPAA